MFGKISCSFSLLEFINTKSEMKSILSHEMKGKKEVTSAVILGEKIFLNENTCFS